jgi:hypothetical protein
MTPHLDPAGLNFFEASLNNSKVYLEFGSGGSTCLASTKPNISHIISVDSDQVWLDRVASDIDQTKIKASIKLIYSDIGAVGDWGNPNSDQGFRGYWTYPTLPWAYLRSIRETPDLILVDGRFRVACTLLSMLLSEEGTLILVDDYSERPEYWVIERYAKVKSSAGRLVAFEVQKTFTHFDLVAEVLHYATNPD